MSRDPSQFKDMDEDNYPVNRTGWDKKREIVLQLSSEGGHSSRIYTTTKSVPGGEAGAASETNSHSKTPG